MSGINGLPGCCSVRPFPVSSDLPGRYSPWSCRVLAMWASGYSRLSGGADWGSVAPTVYTAGNEVRNEGPRLLTSEYVPEDLLPMQGRTLISVEAYRVRFPGYWTQGPGDFVWYILLVLDPDQGCFDQRGESVRACFQRLVFHVKHT